MRASRALDEFLGDGEETTRVLQVFVRRTFRGTSILPAVPRDGRYHRQLLILLKYFAASYWQRLLVKAII